MICSCEQRPDYCPILKRRMTPRQHQICRGEVLTPEKCENLRQFWLSGESSPPKPPIPDFGPGTELEILIKILGIAPKQAAGCQSCAALRDQMNIWGASVCKEHRDKLAAELKNRSKEYSFTEKCRAALNSFGLDFVVNPLDPFGSMVDAAIRKAEILQAE